MKTPDIRKAAALGVVAAVGLVSTAFADATGDYPSRRGENTRQKSEYVFLTGSMIPQKVIVKSIGTATTSAVRVIKQSEIERTGRFTTEGVVSQDPSVSVRGH